MSQSDKPFDKLTVKSSSGVSVDTDQYLDLGAVEQVVGSIIEYVVRKEHLSKLPIAIDQGLIHPPSKETKTLNSCAKEYCSKGCVCSSLNDKVSKRHCGKEECMFHCVCKTRLLHSLRALPHRNTLINSHPAKTSRESELSETESRKKVPKLTETPKKNMRDYEESLPELISSEEKRALTEYSILRISEIEALKESGEKNTTGMKTIQFSEMKARRQNLSYSDRDKLSKIYIGRKKPIHLVDSFVWCTVHKRYSCMCHGRAFDVRTNNFLWMPTTMGVAKRNAHPHQLFDSEHNSARTFGSVFDYRTRNRSFLFCEKRHVEIENEVVSNSNGFIKIDVPPPCLDKKESKTIVVNREPSGNSTKSQPAHKEPKILGKHNMARRGSVCKKLLVGKTSLPVDRFYTIIRKPDGTITPLETNDQSPTVYSVQPRSDSGSVTMVPYRSIKPADAKIPAVQLGSGSGGGRDQVKIIVHDSSSDSEEEDNQLPKYGLLCLNGTMGYIPVREFSAKGLVFSNPLESGEDVMVKGPQEGSDWLNELFRSREVLDPLENKPTWVVVKRGILKKHKPFCWDRYASNPPVDSSTCYLVDD